MTFHHIRKAVFPVAGLGTRFLPVTKDIPKEMMPLIDRPLIHYGVDEAVASGCEEIIFVTGTGKETIFQYFQHSSELEEHLMETGKEDLAEQLKKIPELAEFYYTLQEKPLGLGHAVLCAEEFCKDEYFGLLLPDDVMIAEPTVLAQLESVRERYSGSVLSLEEVDKEDTSRYGIVDAEEVEPGVYRVKGLVEKPDPNDAPSNLAIMGRYVLSPSIFKHLKSIKRGRGGEYQLTDAIASMLEEEPVYALLYKGRRLDCGVREGWIKATIIKALQDHDLRKIIIDTIEKELNVKI
ncbi:MAG: UTP--glucose-1-phosphate uridylyltransferase GalU [Synergistaceae bacterium]|jgi:UTP--glucose-1-phosphate uridylyltransferase|nr:UTP--glucose-1-phosphate uridylyltransferase GalU [Synergistaceae bacterium]MBP9559849.1 UTP--glucose-1-phosphate uridylyltransferase GalU [Synergistaceae bacterium]MCE5183067.1 UTP--glucose-1-phosphate uridylyltransferase GalU [Synergistaceae bacterium]MDD4750335.1 UTP--glucose-1-phosphate uridylyltransferase GalU [Synergistaceae bacterium]MDD4837726.1 UTP--glucose-1-phosphate uridylyltransferase GalU [Synergistaceae bacterium]